MRKDMTPLQRYDAGEDVPAVDLLAQTIGVAVRAAITFVFSFVVIALVVGMLAMSVAS